MGGKQSAEEAARMDKFMPPATSSWVPDSYTSFCQNCSIEFTLTSRRHHCRSCGKLLCASCTTKRRTLRKDKNTYSLDGLVFNARVCDNCYALSRGPVTPEDSRIFTLVCSNVEILKSIAKDRELPEEVSDDQARAIGKFLNDMRKRALEEADGLRREGKVVDEQVKASLTGTTTLAELDNSCLACGGPQALCDFAGLSSPAVNTAIEVLEQKGFMTQQQQTSSSTTAASS